jgi:hypothetical protein
VVLLDEIGKAHPDVLELFFKVFDKGRMEDGEGREIDFRNNLILLTTNAGTENIMKLTPDPETMPDSDGLAKMLKPELDQVFKPAFLGRTVIIPCFPPSRGYSWSRWWPGIVRRPSPSGWATRVTSSTAWKPKSTWDHGANGVRRG